MTFLRTSVLALLAGWLLAAAPNFSGTWKLDVAKSDWGQFPPPDSATLLIEHKDPALKVSAEQVGGMGAGKADYAYTTDGKECTNTVRGTERKSKVTWKGELLSLAHKFSVQGADITSNDTWTLSDDGKTMTQVREISSPQGDLTLKLIYNKQ